jgi:hypothetical protein
MSRELNEIEVWYDFLLQQLAAESYFEKLTDFNPGDALVERLTNGNNRLAIFRVGHD